MKTARRILFYYFLTFGVAANLFIFGAIWDWPFLIDRYLMVTDTPAPAEAIICIAGGMTDDQLPTEEGWQRIYTSVQLYIDGYAPKIIFSGRGSARISEAEVYSEAARWLGCPAEAIVFDPHASSTNEHPERILGVTSLRLGRDSPLDIVTSPLHARRMSLCFKRSGFTRFRMVTRYLSKKVQPEVVRSEMRSRLEGFRPSGRRYDDPLNRLKWRSAYWLTALRELVAIGWYKVKGYA